MEVMQFLSMKEKEMLSNNLHMHILTGGFVLIVSCDPLDLACVFVAKLSFSWLVQPSSVELRFALILVFIPTPPPK